MKRFLPFCLLLAIMALVAQTVPAHAADGLPWLHTSGTQIVSEKGERIVLSGVNLGGWLVEEMWMMPFETKPPTGSDFAPVKDHVTLWRTVEKRFGPNEMRRVRNALRDAWITPADFDRIHAAGLNCVRVPFTYDLLQEPNGFAYLDRALNLARQSGLYVILDLHGAPGRQSSYDHTGEADVNQMFKNPAFIAQTEAVWRQIAERYKDRPEVAGYDLLNEPVGAPDASTLYVVQDRLFRAIRSVDSRHLIMVEDGYKGAETFPQPAALGWDNIVLSWHHYNFGAKTEADQAGGLAGVGPLASRVGNRRNAPIFVGEFQIEPFGTPQVLLSGLTGWQESGHSWTIWTYKTAMTNAGGGMWGWYHPAKPLIPLDPFRDSVADLLRKIAQVRTEAMTENTAMTQAFQAAAAVKPLPPARPIVPTAQSDPSVLWRYATETPSGSTDWFAPAFDASQWKEGAAGFGANPDEIPASLARTVWKTADIYLRREFVLPVGATHFALRVSHDDDAEIYLNGVLAAKLPSYAHAYEEVGISPDALATLKPGKNRIAVHCHQNAGGQYVDVGLVGVVAGGPK